MNLACPFANCHKQLTSNLRCECGWYGDAEKAYYVLHKYDETWSECLKQNEAVGVAIKADSPIEAYPPEETPKNAVNQNDVMITRCIEILGDLSYKKFLDLGGQTGWASKKFVKHGAMGAILDCESKHFNLLPQGFINILGDGYYMPFPDNEFDFVFDCSTLHHFLDKNKILTEIRRVLKDGGIYINQGNPPRPETECNESYEADTAWDLKYKELGLIETWMTLERYTQVYNAVFKDVEFYPIGDANMIVSMTK